jgi:hypothetical protein
MPDGDQPHFAEGFPGRLPGRDGKISHWAAFRFFFQGLLGSYADQGASQSTTRFSSFREGTAL